VVEQEKAQKQIEMNVEEATFNIGSLNSINISVSASSVKEVVLDQIYFSIIAGSFRSIKNAENKVAVLEAEGYPAALAKVNPEGLYRVAYGRYNSKKEAINMLYFLKYTLEEEAWYLEER
jgi:cell division protein FtsN